MDSERWQRLQEIFHTAARLDPTAQAAYVEAACAGDGALRQEVEGLLAASREAGDLAGEVERAASAALSEARLVGSRFGPYRVVRELGQGGMGRVYLAVRDDDQFQRRVAVKVAHAAQAPDLRDRFRSERQILAALDHPNIARLLDGGTTEEGVPYLVLEYVEGEPIDRYCDARELPVAERLRLFRTVCSAVHSAHQSLVVHRDLKPANVLVTTDGAPKLLDFGIAKLLRPELLGQAPSFTTALHRPMTPEYASPEQVRGETVTTASDVYSLGVLLYELLTGCRPLRLEGQSPTGIERIVSEVDPEPPSVAARRPAERADGRAPEERSRARRATPDRLQRVLQGDLDNVVLMALRKAPARRYASAEQLAEDLRRHEDGLPVLARKDTIRYRAGKFVRRNRYPVAFGVAFVGLLLGFGLNRAQLARALAHERDQARLEADTAQHVAAFLEDVFRLADPNEQEGAAITAREILDRAAERLSRDEHEQPTVRAALLDTMGNVYRHLGLYTRAEPMLEQALAARHASLGEEHLDTARSLFHLGELRWDQSRYAEAEGLLRRALGVRERLLPPDHPDRADALQILGIVLRYQGKGVEAEASLRRALALREAAVGDAAPLALTLERLAQVLEDRGELKEAEGMARRSVEIARRRRGEHLDTARCLGRLGAILRREGEFVEAEAAIREALALHRKLLGNDHPMTAVSLDDLGNLLRDRPDLAAAEPVYREAMAIDLRRLGEDHLELATVRADLAELLVDRSRLDEAEELYAQSLAARNRLGADSPFALESRQGLARVAAARGDILRAESLYRGVVEGSRRAGLGDALSVTSALVGLGNVLVARGDAPGAEPLLRAALERRLGSLPLKHWQVAEARSALGGCLLALHRYPEAERLLLDALPGLRGRRAAERTAAEQLVRLYERWGQPSKADPYRSRVSDR
jgi:eukaryotic-like serine/threonine-protein kinase